MKWEEIILIKSIVQIDVAFKRCMKYQHNRYDETFQSVKNPTFSGFFEDNLFRFLLNRIYIIK